MGHSASKKIPEPREGTPASYMYTCYGPHVCQFLEDWAWRTRRCLPKEFPREGTFEMDRVNQLCHILTCRGRNVSPYEWATYAAWYEEASRRVLQAEMASVVATVGNAVAEVRSIAESHEKLRAEIQALKMEVALEREKRLVAQQVVPSAGPEGRLGTHQNRVPDAATVRPLPPPEGPSASPPVPSAPGPVGPATAQPPWTRHELFTLAAGFPEAAKEPEKFREMLRVALACYQPNWAEAQQLLRAVLPDDIFWSLSAEAGKLQESLIGWEQHLLRAFSKVCPRKVLLDQFVACKQKGGEEPADYLARLKEAAERVLGPDLVLQDSGGILSSFFVDGLQPDIKNRVMQLVPGGKAFGLPGLLKLATQSWNKKLRKEDEMERQIRSLQLQDLRSRVTGVGGRGGGRGGFYAVRNENYFAFTYGPE